MSDEDPDFDMRMNTLEYQMNEHAPFTNSIANTHEPNSRRANAHTATVNRENVHRENAHGANAPEGALHSSNCSICMEHLDGEISSLSCRHIFHRNCLSRWNGPCPVCRKLFSRFGKKYIPKSRKFKKSKKSKKSKKLSRHKSKL